MLRSGGEDGPLSSKRARNRRANSECADSGLTRPAKVGAAVKITLAAQRRSFLGARKWLIPLSFVTPIGRNTRRFSEGNLLPILFSQGLRINGSPNAGNSFGPSGFANSVTREIMSCSSVST
jgi:hypothetical protein